MDRIFVSSDFHLWNKKDTNAHKMKTDATLKSLRANLGQDMTADDCWIFLGDLCDYEAADERFLRDLIQSVPARKIICLGNNDNAPAMWYYDIGFDDVADAVRVHNIIFSHKPIIVAPDEINIHGHLHTEKWSKLDHRYITIFDPVLANHRPKSLDDILRDAPDIRNSSAQKPKGLTHSSVEDEMSWKPATMLDLSDKFQLIPVDETVIVTEGSTADWESSAERIIDEVLFPDTDSAKYYLSDDETNRKKSEKADEKSDSVAAVDETSQRLKPGTPEYTAAMFSINEAQNALDDKITDLAETLHETSEEVSYSSSQEVVNGVPVQDRESLTIKKNKKKKVRIVRDHLSESSGGISEAVRFAEVKKVVNSLPKDERPLLYHGANFVNSPNVIYRDVLKTDRPNSTGGFVEIYKFGDDPSTGIMVLAVSPQDRGTGLSDKLISNSIDALPSMGVKRIFCRVVKGNSHSMDMLERNEFARIGSDDHYVKYARDIEHLMDEAVNPHKYETLREYAYEKFANLPDDEINEANIPIYRILHPTAGKTVELYHGTNVKYKTLEPVALDFGNEINPMGWSVFMWDNYDMAKRWALFVTCRELRINGKGPKGHIRFMKTAVNQAHLLASPEDLAEYKAYVSRVPTNMYIFRANIPVDEINIGNDSTHDEFTVRRSVKPDKIDTIRITPKLLDSMCEIMPEHKIELVRKLNKKNMRGLVSPLLNHDYYWVKAHDEDLIDRINGDIRSGRLNPGDDLEAYFADNDIILPTVPFKDRMYRFKPLDLNSVPNEPIAESASAGSKTLGDILKLNRKLNAMQYGLLRPGQKKIPPVSERNYNTTSEDYDNLWKMASPTQFISQNGGVCWDYATYQADYFKRHFKDIPFTTYYIQFNDGGDMPSHTFMTFELNGRHYWFESSFKKVRGIWEAPSENDLIARVIYEMDKHDRNHGHAEVLSSFPYEIFTYDAADRRIYGLGCEEFMDWVHANGVPYSDRINLKDARNARLLKDVAGKAAALSETAKKKVGTSRFSMDGSGAGHTNPLDDREKRASIADKYGLRDVGNTHEEDEYGETDVEKRRKERMKNLRKANRIRRWKRFARRVKRFFTGKNESVGSIDSVDNDGKWIDHVSHEDNYVFGPKERFFEDPERYNDASDLFVEGAVLEMEDTVIFNDPINEAAARSKKLKPVYVVLIHSGTNLASAIKTLTGAQYTHASISFDPSLEHMYSFGAYENKARGRFASGFKMENFKSPWFQSRDISYAVYMVPCTESEYEMMNRRLSYFVRNDTKFKFNQLGLLKNFLGIFDNPQYRFFCSQFVADILHAGKPDDEFLANPGKLRPIDFAKYENAIFIAGGEDLRLYDPKVVIDKTRSVLRAEELKRKIFAESVTVDIDVSNPWASDVLEYQLRTVSEDAKDALIEYLALFKIRENPDGSVKWTPSDTDNLWSRFRKSKAELKRLSEAGKISDMKDELCKLELMDRVVTRHIISSDKKRAEDLEVRNAIRLEIRKRSREIKAIDPEYSHKDFFDSSRYGRSLRSSRRADPLGAVTVTDIQ